MGPGQYKNSERLAAHQRRAQTRGMNQGVAAVAESKSPDKYTINKNLVVNLNDSVVKPVKRENSNTTNATGITGITASTAGTTNTKHNAAFYNTQYKGGNKGGFFQPTAGTGRNNAYLGNYVASN